MPTARKTGRLLVLGVLVGVVAVAFAVWPTVPRLEWYTSPPFTRNGTSYRLRVLLPAGWKEMGAVSVYSRPTKNYIPIGVQVCQPPAGESMPDWFRGLVPLSRGQGGSAVLMWQPTGRQHPDEITREYAWAQREFIARRDAGGQVQCRLIYTSRDHAAFEATYRQICESFRVVR